MEDLATHWARVAGITGLLLVCPLPLSVAVFVKLFPKPPKVGKLIAQNLQKAIILHTSGVQVLPIAPACVLCASMDHPSAESSREATAESRHEGGLNLQGEVDSKAAASQRSPGIPQSGEFPEPRGSPCSCQGFPLQVWGNVQWCRSSRLNRLQHVSHEMQSCPRVPLT